MDQWAIMPQNDRVGVVVPVAIEWFGVGLVGLFSTSPTSGVTRVVGLDLT